MASEYEEIAQKAVTGAIALLDEKAPTGWRDSVNLGRLNMLSHEDCVLGQVYGSYHDGLEALYPNGDLRPYTRPAFASYRDEWVRQLGGGS